MEPPSSSSSKKLSSTTPLDLSTSTQKSTQVSVISFAKSTNNQSPSSEASSPLADSSEEDAKPTMTCSRGDTQLDPAQTATVPEPNRILPLAQVSKALFDIFLTSQMPSNDQSSSALNSAALVKYEGTAPKSPPAGKQLEEATAPENNKKQKLTSSSLQIPSYKSYTPHAPDSPPPLSQLLPHHESTMSRLRELLLIRGSPHGSSQAAAHQSPSKRPLSCPEACAITNSAFWHQNESEDKFREHSIDCTVLGCLWSFNSRSALYYHLLVAHHLEQYQCPLLICGQLLSSVAHLHVHCEENHRHNERWHCHVCWLEYGTLPDLGRHHYLNHQSGHFECKYSGCCFSSGRRGNVNQHYRLFHRK